MIRLLVLSLLLGCPAQRAVECSEDVPCEFGSVCIENVCVAQSCATSDQCGIEQFCSSDHACEDGCQADTDCKFGDFCDTTTNECMAAECTDTHLDCGFGQFCSPAGSCYDAGGYYCKPCEGDGDCGGNGNLCIGGSCGVTCDAESDCPSGYQCSPVYDFNGQVISHQCYADCSGL